jgi:hypothetical protein
MAYAGVEMGGFITGHRLDGLTKRTRSKPSKVADRRDVCTFVEDATFTNFAIRVSPYGRDPLDAFQNGRICEGKLR